MPKYNNLNKKLVIKTKGCIKKGRKKLHKINIHKIYDLKNRIK